MESLKNILQQFYQLLILIACLLFVIHVFFRNGLEGERDVFTMAGRIYDQMIDDKSIPCNGLAYLEEIENTEPPVITYDAGVQTIGGTACFKELFHGGSEDGVALHLLDICNLSGVSVLEVLSTTEIAGLEEIPAPFVYDRELDQLYFFGSGVYTVYVKVYSDNGSQEVYEFRMPVEAM